MFCLCIYGDSHIPRTCTARSVLFFHIIATDFGVHSEVPSVIALHQVRRALLVFLPHMRNGIWGLNLQLLSPPRFAQGLMSASLDFHAQAPPMGLGFMLPMDSVQASDTSSW